MLVAFLICFQEENKSQTLATYIHQQENKSQTLATYTRPVLSFHTVATTSY